MARLKDKAQPKWVPDLRRRRLTFGAAGLLLSPAFAALRPAAAEGGHRAVRFAPLQRTTEHCLPWMAAQTGIFARLGVAPEFPEAGSGPDDPLAGLAGGKWDFAYAGIAQVAQQMLEGGDPVLVVTPLQANKGGFVMTRPEIRTPEQLSGARVGVLSESGASALAARAVLERWQVAGTMVPLQTFEAVYTALAEKRIEAGWLPVDLSFKGRRAHGWNAFQGVRLGIPGGVVTTRRAISSKSEAVAAVVKGLVDAIHLFKSAPATTVPLLQQWLGLEDRAVAADLQAFYAPVLRTVPAPTAFFGMQALRDSLKVRYPAAARMQISDFIDASFVDALERDGYIAKLYSSLRYQ